MTARLADLRQYDGKVATVLWDTPDGAQADRGRLAVHRNGAVEVRDPDSGELRLSLGWRAVQRVLDVYEDLRSDVRFRHLNLSRIERAGQGVEVYEVDFWLPWRIVQGWDGTGARADVWHRFFVEASPKASRYTSTEHSLDEALKAITRHAEQRVSRSVLGGPPGHS
jgi:hypothetical protein